MPCLSDVQSGAFLFLQMSCKMLFSPCLPSKFFRFFFIPTHSVLCFPLDFLDCVSSEIQILGNSNSVLSVLLFLIKLP